MTAPDDPSRPEPDPFREAIRALHADLDGEIARRGPACALSGRCCRFQEYGHTLFVSAPEAALLVAEAPPAVRPLDDGATCPWQDPLGRCTAREARPLGCRLYFCDPAYQDALPELGERYIQRLKRLVDAAGLRWDYAPLHQHLGRAVEAGTFPARPTAGTTEIPPQGPPGRFSP